IFEGKDDDHWCLYSPTRWSKARQQPVDRHVMGKGENELPSYPIIADRLCDNSQLEILWKLLHQTPVELTHTYDSFAARKRWVRENRGVRRQGREGRVDAAVNEFCPSVIAKGLHQRLLRGREIRLRHDTLLRFIRRWTRPTETI